MTAVLLILTAVICYMLGCFSGIRLISGPVLHTDLRTQGNGKETMANFIRCHGIGWAAGAILIDMAKTVVAVLLGALLMKIPGDGYPVVGKLFAGFCVTLGHCYPLPRQFHGGKGVECMAVTLWLADWRVGLVATVIYILLLVFSQYASLAAVIAAASSCFLCWIFVDKTDLKGLAGLLAMFSALAVLWRFRGNIRRLILHREPKIRLGKQPDRMLRDDRF